MRRSSEALSPYCRDASQLPCNRPTLFAESIRQERFQEKLNPVRVKNAVY
jgi:hypothetical protein